MSVKPKRWTANDRRFMAMAFVAARKAKGRTLPNPPVGAVVVKAGKVVGIGGTMPAGQSHAEVVALKQAGQRARGGTLYVTLEPCCHYGRTPPCSLAVIAAGIKKVVVAARDPNPLVGGGGIKQLQKAGIEVRVGLLGEEAADFYEGFFFQISHGRPKVILKIAQSLDGSINRRPGEETAITGEDARVWVHGLRSRVDAVVVGGGTLRVDNPDLRPRLLVGPDVPVPEAVVISRKGPFPKNAKLFKRGRKSKTVVLAEKHPGLPDWVEKIPLVRKGKATVVDQILGLFKQRGYHSVLVEGGPEIWGLFLNSGLWDRLIILTAPKFYPEGRKWDEALDRDWGKSLKFRNLASFKEDFLVEFGNTDSIG